MRGSFPLFSQRLIKMKKRQMSKRGVQEPRRGLSKKIHSGEKGSLDDTRMSQKLEKDPSKRRAFLKHKETAKSQA